MDKSIAEKLLAISTDCSRDTNDSIEQLKGKCDAETFKLYRTCGGRIMGYLFTEIIAPLQSEHPDLAPPDFKRMEFVDGPRLILTKEAQDDLLAALSQVYEQLDDMVDLVRENCSKIEVATYRRRIHEVLMHVADTMVCVLSARVE